MWWEIKLRLCFLIFSFSSKFSLTPLLPIHIHTFLFWYLRPSEANQSLCLPWYSVTSLWSSESTVDCFYAAYLDGFPEEILSPINFLIIFKNMFHLVLFSMCGVVLGFYTFKDVYISWICPWTQWPPLILISNPWTLLIKSSVVLIIIQHLI